MTEAVRRAALRGRQLQRPALGTLGTDALLYGLSALFALGVWVLSHISLYKAWGEMALPSYLAVAAASAVAATRSLAARTEARLRLALCGVALLGALAVPLAAEVAWRFSTSPQSLHVQPEVTVIERAADQLVHGRDPYQAEVVGGVLHGQVPGLPAYEAFFPYLPAMTLFGLPMAASLPGHVGDARIWLALLTLLAVALALWWCPASAPRRLRALQFAVAFPWAALALCTGGDDLPIVALLLVAVVLARRRRPMGAGLVLGLASAMKFTAWPLAGLLLFAARDRSGRRAAGRMLLAELVVAVPVVLPFVLWGPSRLVANVIKFPLGIAGVSSPAGSALPGHLFVSALPGLHHLYAAVVALGGTLAVALYLRRHPPTTVSKVCSVAAWILLVAIALAPATRIGYLLYPANLFVWSWMLAEQAEEPALRPVSAAPAAR
jgi:Glycosyltransferase family 87